MKLLTPWILFLLVGLATSCAHPDKPKVEHYLNEVARLDQELDQQLKASKEVLDAVRDQGRAKEQASDEIREIQNRVKAMKDELSYLSVPDIAKRHQESVIGRYELAEQVLKRDYVHVPKAWNLAKLTARMRPGAVYKESELPPERHEMGKKNSEYLQKRHELKEEMTAMAGVERKDAQKLKKEVGLQ